MNNDIAFAVQYADHPEYIFRNEVVDADGRKSLKPVSAIGVSGEPPRLGDAQARKVRLAPARRDTEGILAYPRTVRALNRP